MEEMHRTHKEPVWGWVSEVALIAKAVQRPRQRPLPIPVVCSSGAKAAAVKQAACS